MSSLFAIRPVSSALLRSATGDMPPPPAKGAFAPDGSEDDGGEDKAKARQKELATCKSQRQSSPAHTVEGFFWIGGSIVAFSRWSLGYMGEPCSKVV